MALHQGWPIVSSHPPPSAGRVRQKSPATVTELRTVAPITLSDQLLHWAIRRCCFRLQFPSFNTNALPPPYVIIVAFPHHVPGVLHWPKAHAASKLFMSVPPAYCPLFQCSLFKSFFCTLAGPPFAWRAPSRHVSIPYGLLPGRTGCLLLLMSSFMYF